MTGKWQQRFEECTVSQEVVEILGYQKVCAYWVPRLLTEEHGLHGKNVHHNCWTSMLSYAMVFFTASWRDVTKAGFIA